MGFVVKNKIVINHHAVSERIKIWKAICHRKIETGKAQACIQLPHKHRGFLKRVDTLYSFQSSLFLSRIRRQLYGGEGREENIKVRGEKQLPSLPLSPLSLYFFQRSSFCRFRRAPPRLPLSPPPPTIFLLTSLANHGGCCWLESVNQGFRLLRKKAFRL